MEIVYCAKCGKMIPPGGVDEGKRYLVGDEALCPKCHEKMSREEHTGRTMVVSEELSLRPARLEPSDPDRLPRPRTSKLAVPAARRRHSTRAHAVVPAAAGRGPGLPALLGGGAAALALAALVAWLALGGPGRDPAGGPTAPPAVTPSVDPSRPAPPSQPAATAVDEARLRAAFGAAAAAWENDREDYAGALALFRKVREGGMGSRWETDAEKAIAEIEAARDAAADAEFARLSGEARRLAEAGNFDGALLALEGPPAKFAELLAGRVRAEREALRGQAEERLGTVLAAAERFSKDGEPDKALLELDEASAVKYAAWADRLKAMRERLAKEKSDVVATAERKLRAEAARRLSEILDGFEERVLAGDAPGAAAFLAAERDRLSPEAQAQALAAGELAGSEKLAGLLVAEDGRRRAELAKLPGREVELALRDGNVVTGRVLEAGPAELKLEVVHKRGVAEIVQVRQVSFGELARGQLGRLVPPAAEPRDADGFLAAAAAAIVAEDAAGAEKALAAAGDHLLAARWSGRLAALRMGEKEAAARRAWDESLAKLRRESYGQDELGALAAGLEAYCKAHGQTSFARGRAGELEALRLAGGLSSLFRGRVVRFVPQTLDVELLWDFAHAEQLADFEVCGGSWRVENGALRGESAAKDDRQAVWTRAVFAPGARAACVGKVVADRSMSLALGTPGDYVTLGVNLASQEGQPTKGVALQGRGASWGPEGRNLAARGDASVGLGKEHSLELAVGGDGSSGKVGTGSALSGEGAGYRTLRTGLRVYPSERRTTVATFDNLRVVGRLDRVWLEAAARRAGLLPVPAMPTAGLAAHWTFDRPDGKTVPDESGSARHGSLVGGVKPVPGRLLGALEFDGKTGRVDVADFGYAPEGRFTAALWFRFPKQLDGGFHYLLSHGAHDKPNSVNVCIVNAGENTDHGKLRTAFRDVDDVLPGLNKVLDVPKGLADGRWHHYTLTVGADGVRVYVDGRERSASRQVGGGAFDPEGPLRIGARQDLARDRFAGCALDDVRIYSRELSAGEVAILAGAHAPPQAAPPGAFEEKNGLVVMEAENFHALQPGKGAGEDTSWEKVTGVAGASGGRALRALPHDRKVNCQNELVGARLDYQVVFGRAGTYRAWMRMSAGPEDCDTVLVGLDGKTVKSAASIRCGPGAWQWSAGDGRDAAVIKVAEPGLHVFNVWVRESRLFIDKIVLAVDDGFRPEGEGPEESPRAAAPAPGTSAGPGSGQVSPLDPAAAKVAGGAPEPPAGK